MMQILSCDCAVLVTNVMEVLRYQDLYLVSGMLVYRPLALWVRKCHLIGMGINVCVNQAQAWLEKLVCKQNVYLISQNVL